MPELVPFHNCYRCTGDAGDAAPDLVLLHGWGLHSIVWDDIMPGLLAHFRVTVIDLPGMGQSPLPNRDYTLAFLAEQMLSVMPEKCHLLGWSLGGLVAMEIARCDPQRVQSLVTLNCSPRYVVADDWPAAMAVEIFDKFAELFAEDAEGTLIRFLALNAKGADSLRDDVRKLKDILYFCGLPAPRALRDGLVILRDTDLRGVLATLSMPMLMLFGEHDHIVPAAVMAQIESLGSGVRLALIRDVAHVPMVSAPDTLVAALEDFWQAEAML